MKGSGTMEFGECLKRLRKEKGLSQEQLAKEVGVTKGAIFKYEAGKREPNFSITQSLEDFFHVSFSKLRREGFPKVLTLGERLKELRKERGLTQEQLAKLLNIPKDTIVNYENNRTKPNFEAIAKLESYFHITAKELMASELKTEPSYSVNGMKLIQEELSAMDQTIAEAQDLNNMIAAHLAKAAIN